jgi:predicted GNAT family N-acyltransferase
MEIKQLETKDIQKLRHEVLWQHKASDKDCVIDADSFKDTFHIGAVKNNEVVGTSTFMVDINNNFNTNKQYRLRAMATSPKVRGKGVGKQIIEFAIEKLKQINVEILWCDARLKATGFYEKLGFKTLGDIYDVPQIGPHKLMYIELNKYNNK